MADLLPGLKGRQQHLQQQAVKEESAYSSELGPIESDFATINKLSAELTDLREGFLASGSKSKRDKYDAKLRELTHTVETCTNRIKTMDQRTKEDVTARRINQAEERQRKNITCRYAQRLTDVTQQQWDLQKGHEADVEKQVQRRIQVRFTDRDGTYKSQEECQQLARALVKQRREDFLFLQARAELEDALAQYHQIIELKEDVTELCRLVTTLHQLSSNQTQELQAVEQGLNGAEHNMERGVANLRTARKM
jgi:syntaxin 1B/2/3